MRYESPAIETYGCVERLTTIVDGGYDNDGLIPE